MTTAIEKYGIMPGAKGRAGAAYYNDAARIVADSAARESQILASQSALALQSIGALGQSLSQGFSSYLQYKAEIKAQGFEREMKLREADRMDTQMEFLRLKAEDDHVSMLQQNQAKSLELSQKWQDLQSAPLLKKADGEAMALMTEAMGAAGRIQAKTERPGDRVTLAGVQDMLGAIAKKAISLGADPTKYQQMSAQLIPLVKGANTLTLSDGTEVSLNTARTAVLNPSQPLGRKVLVDLLVNPGSQEEVTQRNAGYTLALLQNSEAYAGKDGLAKLLALADTDKDPAGARKAAEQAYRYVQLMPTKERDALRMSVVEGGGSGDIKARALEKLKEQLGTQDPTVLMAALSGNTTSGRSLWAGAKDTTPLDPVIPQLNGGTREVDPLVLARLGFEGGSIRDYFIGKTRGFYQRLSGDVSPLDAPSEAMPAGGAVMVGGALAPLSRAVDAGMRLVHGADSDQVRRSHRATADNYVMLAARDAQNQDWSGAQDHLTDLSKFVAAVRAGGGDANGGVSKEAAATIGNIAAASTRDVGGRGYFTDFDGWLSLNAPKLAPFKDSKPVTATAPLTVVPTP